MFKFIILIFIFLTSYFLYHTHQKFKLKQNITIPALISGLLLIGGFTLGLIKNKNTPINYTASQLNLIKSSYQKENKNNQRLKQQLKQLINQEKLAVAAKEKAEIKYNEQKSQYEAKKGQDRLAPQQQKQNTENNNNQNAQDPQSVTVWIALTNSTNYHYNSNCRGLNHVNSKMEVPEKQAIAQGYKLCKLEGGQ